MQYRVVALLPMKANSERIPGKNFKQFHGKPLFSWILSTLLELEEIDQVVINTNAREVLELYPYTNENRVQIRDRHSTICGDYISMNRIIADDLNSVDSEIYVMTHVTNPLLGADTILSALLEFQKAYSEETADSLFSVNKHLTRFYKADGSAINHDPSVLVPTQVLEPWFEENSNLYIFTKSSFLKSGARIGQNPILFETPRFESIDIDDPEDWDLAELIASVVRE